MIISDDIRNAVAQLEQQKYRPQTERWMCHPYQFHEAVKRGIITPEGSATKGHHVMEVLLIEIPKK